MKKSLFLLLFVVCGTLLLPAQSVISGWVNDKSDKKPIGGAAITLHDADGETITYAITRQDGSFSLTVKSDLLNFTLQARLLGYEDVKKSIENKTQQLFIEMSFGEIELREVVVKSRPMWNREDTLVYSVDAFKSLGDKTIGDLLKKLPGVEVSESGGIKYQGESINKFYIEGLDLLENRYGIATNNVPVDAVQNVEIIENHQPVRTLKETVASDKAAVNLRLKKEKMSRPVGTVTLGAGYAEQWLWLAEAFALSAGKNSQFIVMYKTNNASKDVGADLTQQAMSIGELQDVSTYSPKTLLNARSFSYPPLEKKRYLSNNSHAVSANNLWKTSQNSQLRFNVQYLHDVQEENTSRESAYFLPDGTLKINEESLLSRRMNVVDAAVTFTNNSPGYYLNNAFSWNGSWDKASSVVATNGMGVHQHFDMPAQLLKNDLQYVKRWGTHIWDITSFAAYSSQPQQLTVSVDTVETNQFQRVDLLGFYTRNSTYYSLGWGNSSFILKGVLEAHIDRYTSQLSHPVFRDSIHSDIESDHVNLELIPSYMYRNNRVTLTADIALQKHFLRINNPISSNTENNNREFLFANPSLRFNYRFNPMLTARLGYRYTQSIGDFLDVADVYFMSAYRSFSKRGGVLAQNKRQTFNAGIQYRNPLTTFFFNTSVAYAPSVRNTVTTQRFVENESVSGNRVLSTRSDLFLWTGYAGKYFSEIRTNVSLNVSYNSMKGERRQQGVLFPFRSSGWVFMPKLNVKLSDASSVTYQTVASNRITEITRSDNVFRSSLWQVTQQLSAFYLLGKKWQFNGRLEHSFNEIGDNNSVKMFFADFGITLKHAQMEYNLSANNLFNQREYSYSTFTGLDRFDYVYHLRPRMLMFSVSFKY